MAYAVGLAACTQDSAPAPTRADDADPQITPTGSSNALSVDQMSQEYWAAWDTLQLPDGDEPNGPGTWEPEPGINGELVGHTFEVGYGTVTAQFEWVCDWAAAWVEAHNSDAGTAQRALDTLGKLHDTYFYRKGMDEGTRTSLDDMITAAGLGDPGPMSRFVDLNCEG